LVLFSAGLAAIVRYLSFRRLRIKLRELQQQAALDKERARIARDIHDDLGGRLTQIALLSGLAAQERTQPDKVADHVRQISATAQDGIQSLDETVWAVNPRNDTLSHVLDYLGKYAAELLHTAGVRYELHLPDRPPARIVPADVRHNLFLTVKEALNNAVRHARAGEISVRVGVSDDALEISIEDNGRGFVATDADAGADGLRNMRQRMEELGGSFRLDTAPGQGTKIGLVYPWKTF